MPLPSITPKRSGSSTAPLSPASVMAILEAAIASCVKRSARRVSFGTLNHFEGSKPRTSPAIWQSYSLASKRVMRSIPLSPAVSRRQNSSSSAPNGETTPMPVITTLRSEVIDFGKKRSRLQTRRTGGVDANANSRRPTSLERQRGAGGALEVRRRLGRGRGEALSPAAQRFFHPRDDRGAEVDVQ